MVLTATALLVDDVLIVSCWSSAARASKKFSDSRTRNWGFLALYKEGSVPLWLLFPYITRVVKSVASPFFNKRVFSLMKGMHQKGFAEKLEGWHEDFYEESIMFLNCYKSKFSILWFWENCIIVWSAIFHDSLFDQILIPVIPFSSLCNTIYI